MVNIEAAYVRQAVLEVCSQRRPYAQEAQTMPSEKSAPPSMGGSGHLLCCCSGFFMYVPLGGGLTEDPGHPGGTISLILSLGGWA